MEADELQITRYVDALAELHQLALDAGVRQRVINQFTMVQRIVSPLLDYPLPEGAEAAPVFRPD